MTPKAWMAEQRLERASELLCSGYSIKETAARIGYKYPANFSRKLRAEKTAPLTTPCKVFLPYYKT